MIRSTSIALPENVQLAAGFGDKWPVSQASADKWPGDKWPIASADKWPVSQASADKWPGDKWPIASADKWPVSVHV